MGGFRKHALGAPRFGSCPSFKELRRFSIIDADHTTKAEARLPMTRTFGGQGPAVIAANQWRQIIDSATDTAIITTDPQGNVTTWNEGARRILGWAADEMVGHSLDRLFTQADLQ